MIFVLMIAIGAVAAVVFGVLGFFGGGAELERILAFVSVAFAAAGVVGKMTDDSQETFRRSLGSLVSGFMSAFLIAFGGAVFVLTLIPSLYVCLPILGLWILLEHGFPELGPSEHPYTDRHAHDHHAAAHV